MADYNSAYTGAQVDAAVAKSQGIPAAAAITEAVEPAAASAGDVWTADGQGGATWETPSGGGGSMYRTTFNANAVNQSTYHRVTLSILSSVPIRTASGWLSGFTNVYNALAAAAQNSRGEFLCSGGVGTSGGNGVDLIAHTIAVANNEIKISGILSDSLNTVTLSSATTYIEILQSAEI